MCSLRITLAGAGHGGYVALKSLQEEFDSVSLLSNDSELINILRKSDKLISNLEDSDSDIIVCASYMDIITKEQLEEKTIINTHPSLLPKYRGLHSLAWAMINCEPIVGFTIHLMNENIDDGDILSQYKVSVGNKTSKEIMSLFDDYVLMELGKVVRKYILGELTPVSQDFSQATWCCRRNLNDCVLSYDLNHNQLNAYLQTLVPPYPLPRLKINGEFFEIVDARVIIHDIDMHRGRVVNIQGEEVYITFNKCVLVIREMKNNSGEIISLSETFKFGMRLI